MSASVDVLQTHVLSTPGEPQSLALLPSGRPVVGCLGQAPGTVTVVPFDQVDVPGTEPLQARSLLQLSGGSKIALLGSPLREEVFALVHDGPSPAIYGVDCDASRPLWRIALSEGSFQAPVLWRGGPVMPDPPSGLLALDEQGHETVEMPLDSPISAPLVTLHDGGLLLGLSDGTVQVIDAAGARSDRFEAGGAVLGLCEGPGGRLYAATRDGISAFVRGRSEGLWRAEMGPLGGSIAADPRGNVHAALEGVGMAWVSACGGSQLRPIETMAVSDLALDVSGAVLGTLRTEHGHGLLAWPLAGAGAERVPGAVSVGLPGAPVDRWMAPHRLAVLCEGGELVSLRVSV